MVSEKKSSLLYVLNILKENTDKNHLMTYKMIEDKLYDSYGILLERKTIASNIDVLEEFGYDIVKCGKNGLYLGARDFEEGELLFLIDAIYSSKSMPTKYAKDLVKRLSSSFSKYEKKKLNHLEKIDDGRGLESKEIFWTIEVLNEAIEKKKKVEFQYSAYGLDKKLAVKNDGKFYKINPYFMVNNRGKYYLVCNYDKYDDISNYKIECITNIKVLDEDVKPIQEIYGKKKFSIKDYMKEHIYMVSGESVDAEVEILDKARVNDFIDWFGQDVDIKLSGEKIIASLKVNEESLIYWALQYGKSVEILSPQATREKMKTLTFNLYKKYEN